MMAMTSRADRPALAAAAPAPPTATVAAAAAALAPGEAVGFLVTLVVDGAGLTPTISGHR
jgi:hypothetical protein